MNFTILECKKFVAPVSGLILRTINHYELDFYLGGNRIAVFDDREYEISEGWLCFRRPGQISGGSGDYDCFVSSLDFTGIEKNIPYTRQLPFETPEPPFSHILIDNIPDVFMPYHKAELISGFSYISSLPDRNCEQGKLAMLEILMLINADICRAGYEKLPTALSPADTVIKYINAHFREDITLTELAALVNFDKSYLIRVFRTKFGMSPVEYLISCRLGHARALLVNTNIPVGEIAYECGYKTPSFFISEFRKRFGCPPGEYRESTRKTPDDK